MRKRCRFIYFCFFGIRFSGVTLDLVPPVKPDFTVDEDKGYVTEAVSIRYLCSTTSSGAGASDREIMVGFCYYIFYLSIIYQTVQKGFIQFHVLIFNNIF